MFKIPFSKKLRSKNIMVEMHTINDLLEAGNGGLEREREQNSDSKIRHDVEVKEDSRLWGEGSSDSQGMTHHTIRDSSSIYLLTASISPHLYFFLIFPLTARFSFYDSDVQK